MENDITKIIQVNENHWKGIWLNDMVNENHWKGIWLNDMVNENYWKRIWLNDMVNENHWKGINLIKWYGKRVIEKNSMK